MFGNGAPIGSIPSTTASRRGPTRGVPRPESNGSCEVDRTCVTIPIATVTEPTPDTTIRLTARPQIVGFDASRRPEELFHTRGLLSDTSGRKAAECAALQ